MRKSTPAFPLRRSLATLSARGARAAAPGQDVGRPSSEPLYQASVFDFPDIATAEAAISERSGYFYARDGHPNEASFAASVALLEGAEAGVATASGAAAVLVAALVGTQPGDRILCQRDAYGGSRALLSQDLPNFGRQLELVDAYEPAKVADGLSRGARFVFVETLSNPLVREVDLAALAWHCRSYGALLCVDNTLATPVQRRPVEQGAELVLHSATKFLGGHHDCLAGVLVGQAGLIDDARALVSRLGLRAPALDAWLAARGMRTLVLRMERAEHNAQVICERLREHPVVQRIHYPGWGAMLSLDVGDRSTAEQLVRACPQIRVTPSLGGVETSFSHPASSSHRSLSAEERLAIGIGDGVLRLSVGIEEVDELWVELSRALARA